MVEYTTQLDSIFHSLSDSTRRDMLRLLSVYTSLTVGEIAAHYRMTFAGVSKHLKVLESAHLIRKRRSGRMQRVYLSSTGFRNASRYIQKYDELWNDRFDRLDTLFKEKE